MDGYRIFISGMAFDGGKSGISNYILNVVKALSKSCVIDIAVLKRDWHFLEDIDKVKTISFPDMVGKPAINAFWHLFVMPFWIKAAKYDFAFLPAANRRLWAWSSVWTIGTFHDLSQFHLAQKYDRLRTWYVFNFIRRFLLKLDSVCAISESTKNDILSFYKLPEEKVFVNYNGFDRVRLDDNSPLPSELGVENDYILYVSRIEHPGKNHLNLIKAFELLPESISEKYQLVFAGSDWSGAEEVHKYAENSKVAGRIKFLGFIDDAYLAPLYKNASLYAFPSFCEGFGLPLVEAMYCGLPCVCSDRTSLPEIGGDAVLTFDPEDPELIAEKIREVLTDEEIAKRMAEKGRQRADFFDWQIHAKNIVSQYEKFDCSVVARLTK